MAFEDAKAVRDRLKAWLFGQALPLWADVGVDREGGGFFEKIGMDGAPVAAPRRARVATRQVHSFAVAGKMGWNGPWREVVAHGREALVRRYRREDGLFRVLVAADGTVLDDTPAPYEQAFSMLALNSLGEAAMARQAREALYARYGREGGGFYDEVPHAGPLRANPHMHLFETAQAWGWEAMTRDIGEVALTRMIDPATGALPELFDEDWTPLPDADVEPGHQFEWGWLLLRYGAREPALRLIEVGEAHGVADGIAFNALDLSLAPRDRNARLWPQTERIRAAAAALKATGEDRYLAMAASAGRGLERYLGTPVPGLWRDRMNTGGTFVDEPAPASSLYHIVGAISDLDAAIGP